MNDKQATDIPFIAKVRQSGNSAIVTVPPYVRKAMGIQTSDVIELRVARKISSKSSGDKFTAPTEI